MMNKPDKQDLIIKDFIKEIIEIETKASVMVIKDTEAKIIDLIIRKFEEVVAKYEDQKD
jgi:hypothetical protein